MGLQSSVTMGWMWPRWLQPFRAGLLGQMPHSLPGKGATIAGAMLLHVLGCDRSSHTGCPDFEPPPTISVTDFATGLPVCDAAITALILQEDATVTVQPGPSIGDASSCVYYLVGAPPGTYDITATRAGYQSAIARGFVLLAVPCGARGPGQTVMIQLIPD
jgi:hypothetical protein